MTVKKDKRGLETMRKARVWLGPLFFSAVLAGEITVLADLAVAWQGIETQRSAFFGCFVLLTLVFFCVPWLTGKRLMIASVGVPVGIAAIAAAGFLFWKSFSADAVYQDVDSGKEQLYAGRRVMLIVPHEDDEINVLGGVMEEYVKYGSRVYPVFVTNGDYSGLAEARFAEALAVAEYIGIPEENVIFLGYGDRWQEDGPHIYNGEPGTVVTSHNGRTETYGTQAHGAFREGRAYTSDNLLEDMEDVILTYRPDVIFCSDYDHHIDHRATTLVFEKAMGNILKENADYRPLVFKGYAYKTAWYAQSDYYVTNILSTQNVFGEPHWQKPEVYRWEDRVRLPVGSGTLSRSICSSEVFQTLALHASQDAHSQASRVINGDRVVWQRDTNSLCYGAQITVSSSSAELLNDFMLIDNFDLVDEAHMPYDGTWIPDGTDEEKSAVVDLEEAVDVFEVVLYDNPSETDNVLNAAIIFDDGTLISTGPLDPGGAATRIPVEMTDVKSFTVKLVETEGLRAGLTEIEAFAEAGEDAFRFIKFMDEAGNFAYDYWLDSDGESGFFLYAYGDMPESYAIDWDNDNCTVTMKGSLLMVNLPVGESAVLTAECEGTGISDSIIVRNPNWFQRLRCVVCQWMEETFLQGYYDGRHWKSMTYEILDILRYKLLG